MSNVDVEKYTLDTYGAVHCHMLINSVKSQKESSTVNKTFKIGSSMVLGNMEKMFIDSILSRIDCVFLYPRSDAQNDNILRLIKTFGSRVELIDYDFFKIATVVDIFVPFEKNSNIDMMLSSIGQVFLGNPFRVGMSNVEAKQYYFGNQGFIKYYCEQKKIPFNVMSPDDIDYICVGDVLSKDDFDAYTNSNHKAEEQYLLYMTLASKHRKFLERIREINYLNNSFSKDASYSLSTSQEMLASASFMKCLD